VSRREALLLSGSAAALIASAVLPSAIAAASTVELSITGDAGALTSYTLADNSTLYRLIHSSSSTDEVVRTLAVGTTPRTIEMLLVGGGGGGGLTTVDNSVTSHGGGGGGGEVLFYSLGTVAANTVFELHVGGQSPPTSPSDGNPTYVRRLSGEIAEIARARGGGEGGGYLDPGRDGGSGGGGSSLFPARGITLTTPGESRGADGAVGATGTSGGGGGAGGTAPTTGSSTAGGAGGSAVPLSTFISTGLAGGGTVPTPRSLGAGGGGAGDRTGGAGGIGAGAGAYATYGFVFDEDLEESVERRLTASSASNPTLGSGGGGGGGIVLTADSVNSGANASRTQGASGGIWIRVV
jgi:collagen type III alpha